MDGGLVLLTLLVAIAAAIRMRRRAPDEPSTSEPPDPPSGRTLDSSPRDAPWPSDWSPADAAPDENLNAALERVWAEHAHGADTLLDARLRLLVHRGVPVRALRRAPQGQTVRVVFADGTVVLCRGAVQGDFARLGIALHRRSVRLGAYRHDEGRTHLEFCWSPGQRLAALAVGLDQPD